jgi:hypothetical protein
MAVIYAEEKVPQTQNKVDEKLEEYGYGPRSGRKTANYKYSKGRLQIPFQLEIRRRTYKAMRNTPSIPEIAASSTLPTAQMRVRSALDYASGAFALANNASSGSIPRMGLLGHTEGIEIELDRYNKETKQTHPACERVRWVQTVERIESNVPGATLSDHYVDNMAGHPFFGTDSLAAPNGKALFWDHPCASPNHETTWEAVLSLVTWEGNNALRIHAAMSYGFRVLPKTWPMLHLQPLRDASQKELRKHKSVVKNQRRPFRFL